MARKLPSRPDRAQRNTARLPRNARDHSDGTSTLPQAGGSPAMVHMLGGLVIIVVYVLGMQMHTSEVYRGDEMHHHPQIAAFIDGRFDDVGRGMLSMLPGYHAIVAAVAWGVGTHSPSTVHLRSAILCFPTVVLFFLCARALGKDNRVSLSLLFLLCPLVYPYFFLICTDIPALLFLLGVLFLTLTGRYQLAGLMVWLTLLMRQTNIVWPSSWPWVRWARRTCGGDWCATTGDRSCKPLHACGCLSSPGSLSWHSYPGRAVSHLGWIRPNMHWGACIPRRGICGSS